MKCFRTALLCAGLIVLSLAANVAQAQPLRKDKAGEPGYLGLITDDRQEAGKGEERRFPEFGRIPDKAEAPGAEPAGTETSPPATPPQPSSVAEPSTRPRPLTPPQSSAYGEPPRIVTGRALLGVESVPISEA